MVTLHSLSNSMPVRGIQWSIGRPVHGICFTGGVLERKGGSSGGAQGGEGVYVREEGVGFVDVESARVDFVKSEAAVEVV